ncbi:hypothetical protein J6590_005906 [Homalodisca vitripennis]|nr:hypothetical protein J6590_005906 [Homalodisca vitripennis]
MLVHRYREINWLYLLAWMCRQHVVNTEKIPYQDHCLRERPDCSLRTLAVISPESERWRASDGRGCGFRYKHYNQIHILPEAVNANVSGTTAFYGHEHFMYDARVLLGLSPDTYSIRSNLDRDEGRRKRKQ